MKIKDVLLLCSNLTLQQIIKQFFFLLKKNLILGIMKKKDMYMSGQLNIDKLKVMEESKGLSFNDVVQFEMDCAIAEELYRMYMSHRFDLLGSGWVRCGFFDNAPGVEGYKYDPLVLQDIDGSGEWLNKVVRDLDFIKSKKIYGRYVSSDYVPIDWQKDYKTGYRWSAFAWYRPITIARKAGADIKVPWELSRLEHFPQMAVLYKKFPKRQKIILDEFMNQCADFISQNPIRRGVNWMCTMDIGIRTANMVIAYWMFESLGAVFLDDFKDLFVNSIYQHCQHIYNNLEWSVLFCFNHYFADICGLLYGAAFLRNDKKAAKWLKFARKEFSVELNKQFYKEGSNFEGSAGYHRLSGEMAVFAGLLIQKLARDGICKDLSDEDKELFFNIGKFADDITRPDGNFVQIGDNDSGRFFRLLVQGQLMTVAEAKDKYASLAGYTPEAAEELYFDEQVNSMKQLCVCLKKLLENAVKGDYKEQLVNTKSAVMEPADRLLYENEWRIDAKPQEKTLLDNLQYVEYPQFGIYIFRSPRIFLCFNGTDNGQKGNAGHAHNDKLSFELWIDSIPVFQDPGTYVYTALPEERNRYRGVCAHNGMLCGREQNKFKEVFSMENETICRKIEQTENSVMLEVSFSDIIQRRKITIEPDGVLINDSSNHIFEVNGGYPDITEGYGKVLNG